jgi:CheY-like chemotaxis protein/HPt (histidine-containing phosphotransfer) domain-containing protein
MGGHIDVESAPGAGSSFSVLVDFPLDLSANASGGASVSALEARATVPSFTGARILLVEDNPFNQLVAREIIERTGATVRIAQNGEEGVEAVQTDAPFNLVLMDIQMPLMDGYEATRRIRQTVEGRGPVILAMTANVTPEDRARCRAAGMEDFVPKPIVPEHLYAVLARWLRVLGATPTVSVPEATSASTDPSQRPSLEMPNLLYDADLLDSLVGDDRAFFADLVQQFIASSADTMQGWQLAVAAHDLTEVGRLGHRFKSAAAMIGALSLRDHAQALDRLGKEGDASTWPTVLEHVRALDEQIATITEQLRARLVENAATG